MGTRRASRVGRFLAVVVVVVFVGVAVFAGEARAAYPGHNGQISFVNNSSGSAQIARINPDGSHRDQLTHTSTKHNSFFSDWSPNGVKSPSTATAPGRGRCTPCTPTAATSTNSPT